MSSQLFFFVFYCCLSVSLFFLFFFFFFNDTATTEIYTLSLHTLFRSYPLWSRPRTRRRRNGFPSSTARASPGDRKSTRLNSSHTVISYAVFCLKKKKKKKK